LMSYNSSNKGTTKTRESAQITDLAVEWLIEELTTAATKAHIFQLSEVWQRYCDLAENAKIAIRSSYTVDGVYLKKNWKGACIRYMN